MSKPIPEFDTDLFSKASVRDAREVASFEPAGPAVPWMTTIGRGPVSVPVRVRFN